MRAEGDYHDYLQDMIEATDKVASFIAGLTEAQFLADDRTQFAVVRALEILGEASKKIPASFKSTHGDIPWREVAGMRDKLVHDYFGVNAEVVWKTATADVPPIARALRKAIGEE